MERLSKQAIKNKLMSQRQQDLLHNKYNNENKVLHNKLKIQQIQLQNNTSQVNSLKAARQTLQKQLEDSRKDNCLLQTTFEHKIASINAKMASFQDKFKGLEGTDG